MKKVTLALMVVGLMGAAATTAQADPKKDLEQFRNYFKQKFPTVKFDEYSNGFYHLPGMESYREQFETLSEFPPYEIGLGKGTANWNKKFPNGKTFADCFPNGGKKIAQKYPYWDEATKKVRTAEMDVMDCAKKNGAKFSFLEANLDKDTKARVELAEIVAHFYTLSRGERVSVDVSKPGALAAYEAGKKFWWQKRGQLNFACADCHMELAGKNFGGGQPLSAALGHPVGWPAQRVGWARLETIHRRYVTCNSQVRAKPFPHSSEIYNNLQFYETYLSSGLPLTAPAMRN
ncbi:MAG: sulfur oxidation c-type cytochrome SoxA [Pseudomonadota bacterium]|nr:MAG: sulfur oxidation c-type cytochrome SoxA [Pseudomonadota bacterium]